MVRVSVLVDIGASSGVRDVNGVVSGEVIDLELLGLSSVADLKHKVGASRWYLGQNSGCFGWYWVFLKYCILP